MIKSMTGYGKSSLSNENYILEVEMKTVNHRYLDINIRMPKSLLSLEHKIKKEISSKLKRGKVDVFITYYNLTENGSLIKYDKGLAESYVKTLKELSETFDIENDTKVSLLSSFPDLIYKLDKEVDHDDVWDSLKSVLNEAVEDVYAMRKAEGFNMKKDMEKNANEIINIINIIEEKDLNVTPLYKEKLLKRIKELNLDSPVDENKVALEVTLFADKSSINEEIARLKSHMALFFNYIESRQGVIGRKLDFLAQEMNREANTITSKSVDIEITNNTLEIKNYIENLREQMQNIE